MVAQSLDLLHLKLTCLASPVIDLSLSPSPFHSFFFSFSFSFFIFSFFPFSFFFLLLLSLFYVACSESNASYFIMAHDIRGRWSDMEVHMKQRGGI